MSKLLHDAAARSVRYLEGLNDRPVAPSPEAVAALAQLDQPLPDGPTDPAQVLALLDDIGSPATVVNAAGRYFGFVNGGSLPAALAANWLAGAWDQNAGLAVSSPTAAALEAIAGRWLLDVLALPEESAVGFVTGATEANFTSLAAARHALLARAGWDVESQGLFGAPPFKVVVGDEVHVSLLKALSLLGLGRERVVRVPVDGQGRMRPDRLPPLDERTILCLQAGNVNTGAFDPADELCAAAKAAGSWVHIDGAFGLWAAAAPQRAHLAVGLDRADSWAVDAHKWLNVPYDCGFAIVRRPEHLSAAMTFGPAAYLNESSHLSGPAAERPAPVAFTPAMSRRARGVEVWAALRSLGRTGLAQMIERCCQHAARFARELEAAGFPVLNEVLLNQVLVSFGQPAVTRGVITALQREGTCWCGGTVWQGQTAMRISVSSWATTGDDVTRTLAAIMAAARGAPPPTSP